MKITEFLSFFPPVGFLFIVAFLSVKIWLLKKKGVQVRSGTPQSRKTRWILYAVFAVLFAVWFFQVIKPVFRISLSVFPETVTNQLVDSVFLHISGAFLILVSLVFLALTLVHFNTSLRFGLDKNNRGKLITAGVFSFSRNPFFLSLNLYFWGIALILPSVFFIGFALLAVVSIHFFILKEEKFLRSVYGGNYKKYAKKVRRYF
jgi:protein-S-isoprenylcysteine O-methyltransferase Ste14